MPVGYKHFKWEHPNVDIGICACHVWLGLIDKGYNPAVTVNEDSGRAVWKFQSSGKDWQYNPEGTVLYDIAKR